jgi:MFS family permease
MSALYVPFVVEAVGGDAQTLGWLMSAQAVGGLLGGAVVAQVGARVSPLRLFGPSAVLFGLIDLAIFNIPALAPGPLAPLLLFILVGLPAVAMGSSMLSLLQESADDAYRGRVFGAFGAVAALLTLAGLALGGALGDRIGVVPVISLQGHVHVLVGLLAGPLLATRPAAGRAAAPEARPDS